MVRHMNRLTIKNLLVLCLLGVLTACSPNSDIEEHAGSHGAVTNTAEFACLANDNGLDYGSGLHAPSPAVVPRPAASSPANSVPQCGGNKDFRFGVARADITGPAAGKILAGIESSSFYTAGIHTRQYARSYVIESPCNGKRVAMVLADVGMLFESVHDEVVTRLNADPDTAGLFQADNVMIGASHTHSTPGGHSHYDAWNFFRLGYDDQVFQSTVEGIVRSIKDAHQNLQASNASGEILLAHGELSNANKNRAIPAYMNNPESERNQYLDSEGNDITSPRLMTLLKLIEGGGKEIGSMNWFGVHPTADFYESTQSGERPISGDSKGYASYKMERLLSERNPEFVSAFMQPEEGDVFPGLFYDNPEEAAAQAAKLPEDEHSPVTVVNGNQQLLKALELYAEADEPLSGPVDFRFGWVEMNQVEITDPVVLASLQHPAELDTNPKRTCTGALGASFPVGGGGAPPGEAQEGGVVEAGVTCGDPDAAQLAIDTFRQLSAGTIPTSVLAASVGCNVGLLPLLNFGCQAEKPVLIPVGPPFNFSSNTVPYQLLRIGNLLVAAVPFEITTMAARRLRSTLLEVLKEDGVDYVVINGLSNDYVGYLTTREEYAIQQYEGASTQFGPWQLAAVQQEMRRLALDMANARSSDRRSMPPAHSPLLVGVIPPQGLDVAPPGSSFGDVTVEPNASYAPGEVLSVAFQASSPNSDLKTESSFLFIEREVGNSWETVAVDADPETTFRWSSDTPEPQFNASTTATATIEWRIPRNTAPGTYRIRFESEANQGGMLTPYQGETQNFAISGPVADCP